MIAHLLDKAPVSMQEEGFKDAVMGAVMGETAREMRSPPA